MPRSSTAIPEPMDTLPRGIRNNNPGNIRKTDQRWQGLSSDQTDPDFFQFEAAIWGIRAIADILLTYRNTDHLRTVDQIIARWAPPNENNTIVYAANVAQMMGVSQTDPIDVADFAIMLLLIKAIITHENGIQPYLEPTFANSLALLGIYPVPASIKPTTGPKLSAPQSNTLPTQLSVPAVSSNNSSTLPGGIVAAAGGLLASIKPLAENFLIDHPLVQIAPWIAIAVVLAGAGWVIWKEINKHRASAQLNRPPTTQISAK